MTNPANGDLGSIQQGNPSTVFYTPKLNFSGSDSFTFKGNDGTSDSAPATVSITVNTLTFAKAASGRRVGGICRRTTRANRRRPRCTRYVTKGSLRRTLRAGLRRVRFQGRLTARKRLTLGRYRLRIGAVDIAGSVGTGPISRCVPAWPM